VIRHRERKAHASSEAWHNATSAIRVVSEARALAVLASSFATREDFHDDDTPYPRLRIASNIPERPVNTLRLLEYSMAFSLSRADEALIHLCILMCQG